MSLSLLRNRQMFALFILTLVTVLILSLVIISTVAHINVWHSFFSWGTHLPDAFYPRP